MSLREQNKQRTRRALGDAAITLFTEHGYDAVTMADVATLAGVSRRTAFRYFASKDELVMEHPAEWMAVFDESVAAHQHLPTGERLRVASHAIVAHIERDPDPVRQLLALTFAHPALTARYAASSHSWITRVAAELKGTGSHVSLEDKILAHRLRNLGHCRRADGPDDRPWFRDIRRRVRSVLTRNRKGSDPF